MKKNRYEVWKQTFSELDFETLRLESAGLGISLNARQHRSSGRNKPYSLIEDFEVRQSIASFLVLEVSICCTVVESDPSQLLSSEVPG
jgi:hypothetical protein